MKNYFLWVLLLAWPWWAQAQPAPLAASPDSLLKVNFIQSGRYTHVAYTMNGELITTGTLKKLLAKYPEPAAELRKYRAHQRNALLLLPVFIAGIVVGGLQADQHRYDPGSNFSKAPVPFSIGLGAFVGSLVLAATNDHFEKAIEAYNNHFHAQSAAR